MMIFVAGIHGVGKSFFCEKVKSEIGVDYYSASRLISERKQAGFPKSKLIPDIDENQQYLIDAVNEINVTTNQYLLDGHCCLLDGNGTVTRIAAQTFLAIQPSAILVLTETPGIIAARGKTRDGIARSESELEEFQLTEVQYAKEIAALLGVPLQLLSGTTDIDNGIDFIKTIFGGNQNGR